MTKSRPDFRWIERHKIALMAVLTLGFFSFADLALSIGAHVLILIDKHNVVGMESPYYHHDLKPNFSSEEVRFGTTKIPIRTNSLGFKDRAVRTIPLKTNKHRIVMIGDSFTEGVGVPHEETFVGLYEKSKDPEKFEVLNAGVVSYSPKLYYLKLKHLLEDVGLEIHELFVLIDISDIEDELLYEHYQPGDRVSVDEQDRVNSTTTMTASSVLKKTYLYSFYKSARKALKIPIEDGPYGDLFKGSSFTAVRAQWTDNDFIFEHWGARGVTLAIENMDRLHQLAKKHGVKLHIGVYPWPYQIAKKDLNCRQAKIWREFSEQRGIDFINLFPAFVNETPYPQIYEKYFIQGDVHWNAEGHRLIAQHLLER